MYKDFYYFLQMIPTMVKTVLSSPSLKKNGAAKRVVSNVPSCATMRSWFWWGRGRRGRGRYGTAGVWRRWTQASQPTPSETTSTTWPPWSVKMTTSLHERRRKRLTMIRYGCVLQDTCVIFLLCVYIYLLNVGRCGQAYASWPVSGCGSVEKQCFTRIWGDAPRTTVAPWWRTAPNLSQQETVRNEGASSVTRSLKRIIPVNLMHPKTPLLPPCSMFRFCHFYNISWLNCWAIDKSLDENKCIQT